MCVVLALGAGLVVIAGVGLGTPPRPDTKPPHLWPAATPSTRLARRTQASPPRPPPPVVSVPISGEPDVKGLAETKLVSSSCEQPAKFVAKNQQALIRKMRAEVDAAFDKWKRRRALCGREPRLVEAKRGAYDSFGPSLRGIGAGAGGRGEGIGLGAVGAVAAAAPDSVKAAQSASGTNTQVAGVDEADLVKNDGRYVYLAMNGSLFIFEALTPRLVSTTQLDGAVRELFVSGDRVVVYLSHGGDGRPRCTYGYDCQVGADGSATQIVVFDVSDRAAPRAVRELGLSGSLIAARRIGRMVHTVVSERHTPPRYSTWPKGGLEMCGPPEATRARFEQLKLQNQALILASYRPEYPVLLEGWETHALCDPVLRPRTGEADLFTSVVSFDMTDQAMPKSVTLRSAAGAVFASGTALYVAVPGREISDIHKVGIGEEPSQTRYLGSGAVPGRVLNQFAMDEWYGYLRIATTRRRLPNSATENLISVLADTGKGLVRVGSVEQIAPGEDIRSVRFDGDRGYVVTFKKTDPLFVLDLYEPDRPKILGELKIPGFSTYMQRIDPDHLLSIGFDAEDRGSFAYFGGVMLQLFDVSDPAEPVLLYREKIGSRGSSSEAATNHLAFNYFAERGLLAIPTTICKGGDAGVNGDEVSFSGLLVYRVGVDTGFTRLGGIDHGVRSSTDCQTWWSNARSHVKRSIFLDDLVYSISPQRLIVQRLGAFGTDVANFQLLASAR